MLPVLLTQTIILFQDVSLVSLLNVTDFVGAAVKIAQRDSRVVEMYLFVAVVYFVLCFSLSVRGRSACSCRSRSSGKTEAITTMIEIKNVSKWYGSFQVLTDCTTTSTRAKSWSCAVLPGRANRR